MARKTAYDRTKMEVISFGDEDVIATSGGSTGWVCSCVWPTDSSNKAFVEYIEHGGTIGCAGIQGSCFGAN